VGGFFDNSAIIFKGDSALLLEELFEESYLDGAFLEEKFCPEGTAGREW
jgi:hypothetical protein